MAKAFSVASWNVEHFKNDPQRVPRVVSFVNQQSPDVLALYEVEGADVFAELVQRMPGYQFHITEGPQTQEILIGVRSGLSAFFTQRIEFKSGNTYLRPGALLTITVSGKKYPVLFLHTKSSSAPVGLGIRDDMFERAFEFRKTLDKVDGPKWSANYIFLGDLNTMGMIYPFQKGIGADVELQKLDKDAKAVKMRRLSKDQPNTWSNGPNSSIPNSNLDHVLAAEHLKFKQLGGSDVSVRGWASLTTATAQAKWIKEHSDHSLLYFEVQKVTS